MKPKAASDQHQHQFNIPDEKTTLVYRHESIESIDVEIETAKDVLKLFKCKCGKALAYDLERMII